MPQASFGRIGKQQQDQIYETWAKPFSQALYMI